MFIMMCACYSTYILQTHLNYLQFSRTIFAKTKKMWLLLGILSVFTFLQAKDPYTLGQGWNEDLEWSQGSDGEILVKDGASLERRIWSWRLFTLLTLQSEAARLSRRSKSGIGYRSGIVQRQQPCPITS